MNARGKRVCTIAVWLLCYLTPCAAFDILKTLGPFRLAIGPEISHLERKRQGGTNQHGILYGGKVSYDRIPWNGLYLGIDARKAHGRLHGHTGRGFAIKSTYTESEAEGRLGISLGCRVLRPIIVAPYAGYGAFRARNAFSDTSPIPVHFRDRYEYASGGVLLLAAVTDCVCFGVHGKVKWPFDPKIRASNDPDNDDNTMLFDPRWQYMVELPATYRSCVCGWNLGLSLVPFWERREYGAKANFPFDFIETRYTLYGARLMLDACF